MKVLVPILLLLGMFMLVLSAAAQDSTAILVLDFNRDMGYGGFGGDIQGRFSLKVSAPEDIVRVAYYLDDELVFESSEPPFRWQFNTASFPEGRHTFRAVGYKEDGTLVLSQPFTRIFLSSEQAWGNTGKILLPILILVGLSAFFGVLAPLLAGRKKVHVPGVYSMAGGAICPRCTFPFSRSVFAPNLLFGKLERCPHCSKWAILPRASVEALRAAELRLTLEGVAAIETPNEGENLMRMIEDSRFEE